jgi:hypothetical protein
MTANENVPFYCQIFACVIVIVASLLNLSLEWGDKQMWTIFLTSALGILMPHFELKKRKPDEEN